MSASSALSFALALLLVSPALAEPAADGEAIQLSEAELGPVYNVANTLATRTACDGTTVDLAAAGDFDRAAALLDVAARHFPAPRSRSNLTAHAYKRIALVEQAVQLYEQAYQCAPGYAQRHRLEAAIALLDATQQTSTTIDRLPASDPTLARLAARRSQVAMALPQPPPRPPAPVDVERPRRHTPSEPAPAPEYHYNHSVLRLEIGGGPGRIHFTSHQDDKFHGFYAQLFAATRIPLGEREVHAFLLGGELGLQQVAPPPSFDTRITRVIPHGGLRLEFAIHLHPRWVSLHPGLGIGAAVYVGREKFGRAYAAPGLGLCFERELLCLTARLNTPFTRDRSEDSFIRFGQFGLALDIMRIVDRRRNAPS